MSNKNKHNRSKMSFKASKNLIIDTDQVKKIFPLKLSCSKDLTNGKTTTFGYEAEEIMNAKHLYRVANRWAISPSFYKHKEGEYWVGGGRPSGGHRRNDKIIEGGRILLIDCDGRMPDGSSQASVIEEKLEKYFYVKVPSASNSDEKPYKSHYIIPVEEPRPIFPQQFKWQTETFFDEVGITKDMCDIQVSLQSSRVLSPAIAKGLLTGEQADARSIIHEGEMLSLKEAPEDLAIEASSTKIAVRKYKTTVKHEAGGLSKGHVWFNGTPMPHKEAYNMILEQGGSGTLSGFGCPHDNHSHTADRTRGYGIAYLYNGQTPTIKCSGNACQHQPFFVIPHHEDISHFFQKEEETSETIKDPCLKPIHPEEFKKMVKDRVSSLSPTFKFGKAMLQGFYYYGAVYNDVLTRNINDKEPKRFAVPAPTGSAKSVSAKLYLASIAKMGFSGMLVVGKNSDARETVEEINEIAGSNIAVCTYTADDDFENKVSINDLSNYRIIVITHNLFLSRSHTLEDIEKIRDFQGKNRAVIIIDEKINFRRTTEVRIDDIESSIGFVKFKTKRKISGWKVFEDQLKNIIDVAKSPTEGTSSLVQNEEIQKYMFEAITQLKKGEGQVLKPEDKGKADREAENRIWLIRLFDRIAYILSHQNIINKQGLYYTLTVNEDLTNRFGSVVILDATMKSSLIYRAHANNRDDLIQIALPDGIRNYERSTLHIWYEKKAKQSRGHMIHQAKELKRTEGIVETYLSILYPLVDDGEPLLVCVFKDLIELFHTKCKSDLITFIHWGVHAGTNDYQHYTKACAIGWNRKPPSSFLNDIDAILPNSSEYRSFSSEKENKSAEESDVELMARGELASDFVQFFNRTRSRVSVDEEGRSAPTHFYMIHNSSDDDPLDFIEKEMPGIVITDWEVAQSYPLMKLTKTQDRAERVVGYLLGKPGETLSKNNIIIAFDGSITKKSEKLFRGLTKSKYFIALLEENQIGMRIKQGRGGGTYFDVPEIYIQPEEMEMKKAKEDRIILNRLMSL